MNGTENSALKEGIFIYSRILGTGSFTPEYVLTNDFLSTIVDTNDEWIKSRSGISQRRINQDMPNSEMAANAARKAMENAGAEPSDIDFVLVATISADHSTPSMACVAANLLGIKNAIAYDISVGCSGFVYALELADMYIKCGKAKRGLIICSETLSRVVDYTDRSTCVLFGDAAGAVVVGADEQMGLLGAYTSCEPEGSDTLYALKYDPHVYFKDGKFAGNNKGASNPFLFMNGKEVFKFAVRVIPSAIERALEAAGRKIKEVDYFILHQANKRILDYVRDKYEFPAEKVPMNIEMYGNTSSASIPLLLDELNMKKLIKRGQLLVLCGFGAGLSYGAVALQY